MDILIFIFQVLILFCVGYLAISKFINGNDTFHTNKILNNLNDLQNRLMSEIIKNDKNTREDVSYCIDKLEQINVNIDNLKAISNTNLSQVTLNHIVNLTDFEIYYFTPYDGYLSINADYCEIRFLDDSQIIIKNHLKNFFLEARKTISIRNIRNLKNIRFEKKNKK